MDRRKVSPLVDISEKEFTAQVVELARYLGWNVYHPWVSIHSASGWPDLVLCCPPRLILAELKNEKGKLTPAQVEWFDMLNRCPGVETYLWRPSQWETIVGILSWKDKEED